MVCKNGIDCGNCAKPRNLENVEDDLDHGESSGWVTQLHAHGGGGELQEPEHEEARETQDQQHVVQQGDGVQVHIEFN